MGGASASLLASWARLSPGQRKLLMACGGGAGLAAVYNVPLGGALFTAEIMMGMITLPVALPAVACSSSRRPPHGCTFPVPPRTRACRTTGSPCHCWCGPWSRGR